jgi:hypothetical protein
MDAVDDECNFKNDPESPPKFQPYLDLTKRWVTCGSLRSENLSRSG